MSCRVPGCSRLIAGTGTSHRYGHLCSNHRFKDRRYGDPEQNTLKARELAPYIAQLDQRRRTDPEAQAWAILDARWGALVATCKGTLRAAEEGQPMPRWDRAAAGEIVRVSNEASSLDAWRRVVALFILREEQPRAFASERAFLVQLSLHLRRLARGNRGTFRISSGGKRYALLDINVRVAMAMGALLRDTFGVAGIYFAKQEQAEEERRKVERNAFHEAMRKVAPEGVAIW